MCKETGKYHSIGNIKPHDNGSSSDSHSDDMYDFEVEEISSLDSIDEASVELPNTEDTKKKAQKFSICCVCLENIGLDVYSTNECNHSACRDCMHGYLDGTTSDPRYENYEHIFCPGLNCDARFVTGELLPKVFTEKDDEESWWSRALTRVFMQNSTVCPFDDCTELFDAEEPNAGECVFAECHSCHRGFCLGCRKKWHVVDESNISENVRKATEMLENMMLTAEEQNWSRCPQCKNMVEKNAGCDHIACRCGTHFCYRCGSLYGSRGCVNSCAQYDQKTLQNVRKPMFYVDRFDRNRNNQH